MLRCPKGPEQQGQPAQRAVAPTAFYRESSNGGISGLGEGDETMREAPDLYVVVPGLGSVAAASTSVAYPLIWPAGGKIVQVMCFPVANGSPEGMTSLGFAAQVEGSAGQGFVAAGGPASSAFLLFAAMPNTVLANAGMASAFHDRMVRQSEKWSVTFNNLHPTNAYIPYLAFGLKRQ